MIDLDLSESAETPTGMPSGESRAHINFQFNSPGKHHGHLCLPDTDSSRGPAQLALPVSVIQGQQPGPVVTFIAGIHGDEPEGVTSLLSLAELLDYKTLRGTIYLLPALNMPALKQGLRTCPLDGSNMDSCFPGRSDGTISERLAFEITQHFIKSSELVVDMRSGGRHLVFDTCAAVGFSPSKEYQKQCEETMISFGLPNSVRLLASAKQHSLQQAVSALGKCYVQTEIGGGAGYNIQSLDVIRKGCRNVLRHWNMLDDEIELSSTRLLEVRDNSYYIYASDSGLYEPCAHIGHTVWKADTIARLWNPQTSGQSAQAIISPRDAILFATHHGGWVESGDLLAILAEEVRA